MRPPGNRTPNSKEISLCLESTVEHIKIIKPKLLILIGELYKFLLNSKEGITKLRGKSLLLLYENESKVHTRAIIPYLLRKPIEKKNVGWYLEIDSLIKK